MKKFFALAVLLVLGCNLWIPLGMAKSLPALNFEEVLCLLDLSTLQEKSFSVSSDNKRVTFVERLSQTQKVVSNGKNGNPYDRIVDCAVFSPDSKRMAYVAQAGNKMVAVIDGKESTPFDSIQNGSLIFSPDSNHVAFIVAKGISDGIENNQKYQVVLDGVAGPEFDSIAEDSLDFTPRNQAFYVGRLDRKKAVVINQRPGTFYDDIGVKSISFSKDGGDMAYSARIGERWHIIRKGKVEEEYDAILENTPVLSPDGRHIAYAVRENNQWYVIHDERQGKLYDSIQKGSIVFSPDSKKIAYVARFFQQDVLVTDERVIARAGSQFSTPAFSPDSQRITYLTKDFGSSVMMDGKKLISGIFCTTPIFSPDGKKMACIVVNLRFSSYPFGFSVVVNGKRGKKYQSILPQSLKFSPTGKHLVYVAMRNNQWFMVLDGEEGKPYDDILLGKEGITFDGEKSLHYVAVNQKNLCLVRETLIR